jgi:hypothetical protein
MLVLKLVLTPVIIGGVTLVGRRHGPRVAGLAVGLPLTTGPVSAFLAAERGAAFAIRAAAGAVVGLIGAAVFCATYAGVARRREWPVALGAATVAIAATTLLLTGLGAAALPLPVMVALAIVTMILLWAGGSRLVPVGQPRTPAPRAETPVWDLPARMAVSTAMVAAVTAAAPLLGSRLSGVLSAMPVFSGVLGVFTHRHEGRAAAVAMLRGTVIGCVSGVLFFAVVGEAAAPGRLVATYAAAALLSVVAGVVVSHLTRPRLPARLATDAGDDERRPTWRAA